MKTRRVKPKDLLPNAKKPEEIADEMYAREGGYEFASTDESRASHKYVLAAIRAAQRELAEEIKSMLPPQLLAHKRGLDALLASLTKEKPE